MRTAEDKLSVLSPLKWECCLEYGVVMMWNNLPDIHGVLEFDALQILDFGLSKFLK